MSGWPLDYDAQLTGVHCPLCNEGRPEEIGMRIRFFSCTVADAYLHRHGVQRGYVALIWRGRHVVDPTELAVEEGLAFWNAMLQVSAAMQTVYQPLKMNYQLLGNRMAHLHWLIAPRFRHDIAPGDPLPGAGYHDFPEEQVQEDIRQLRDALIHIS